jgi:hypothetical protein
MEMAVRIKKIISGGQTGADRAALDFAIQHDIPHGGWVPRGRRAEDGRIPAIYRLNEMSTKSYPKRTERNVLRSDGTLIISRGELSGGSALTRRLAQAHGKPFLHIDLNSFPEIAAQTVASWIRDHAIQVLNVAGSRASEDPDIYQATLGLLDAALQLE